MSKVLVLRSNLLLHKEKWILKYTEEKMVLKKGKIFSESNL